MNNGAPRNALQQLIADHCAETGDKLADIAERGGMPHQTLSAILHRTARSIPRRETLAKLAKGLDMDLATVEQAAARAASAGGEFDIDPRLATLIAHARKLDDARIRALVVMARALSSVE
jgi:transcriptional regulator with XRE-family HTH domain